MLSLGSRGDVQPMLALAAGLQELGVSVRLATHAESAPLVRAYGVELAAIATNPSRLLESEAGRDWVERGGRDPVTFIRGFRHLVGPILEELLEEVWTACQGSGAVVFNALGGSFTFAGLHVADALAIPYVGVQLWPATPTRAFPSIFLADRVRDLGPLNRVSHRGAEQLFWQPFRAAINRWRTHRLQVRPLPFGGPHRRLRRARTLQLCAYSPTVVPVPPDWPVEHPVTGYWFLDRPSGWEPPAQLAAFLAAGPAPVYVGFGSMTGRDGDEQTDLVLSGLRGAGHRGLLATGGTGVGPGPRGENAYVIGDVPHDWLFPRTSAVVVHGGAGTTAAALRAGVPTVIAPSYADQPFWARRVLELGAGPAPVPRRELTADRLGAALRSIGEPMRGRAADLGERIRAETGVATATEHLLAHLRRH